MINPKRTLKWNKLKFIYIHMDNIITNKWKWKSLVQYLLLVVWIPSKLRATINSKKTGSVNLSPHPPWGFSKNAFSGERVNPCFFVTFNIIASHIFPEDFIEIPQVIQKVLRFSSSILTIFIDFLNFLTFPCYKETNNVII